MISPITPWRAALVAAATTAPSLLAWNVSPSSTFLNQALALALWGLFVVASASAADAGGRKAGAPWRRGDAPLLAALALVALAALASWQFAALPSTLALSALGVLAAAAVLVAAGHAAGRGRDAADFFALFAWGLAVAGAANVLIALVQVFAPTLADGDWIARSSYPGRAVGNLRQPNHLSSLLLWGCIGVVALAEMRRLASRWAALLLALMVLAVVLTASRTGLVSVLLLALWGALDRRLSRPTRALLLAAPLVYLLVWLGMAQWAALTQHSFGGSARLAETDISSSRFAIWSNTLALIAQQPLAGVGFGEFNYAWTLTPFPSRPTAFFDHTHNLPLQLAVEIGLPLATLVTGLLLWALWRAARGAWGGAAVSGDALNAARRCAAMVVLMIGLHSLLEYPLWYAYFLLPTAWAWGFALGAGPSDAAAQTAGSPALPRLAGAALVAGAAFAVVDYQRVAVIFSADADATPLVQRVADGRRSVFFGHHADYAAVTSGIPLADPQAAFARATHYLLDTRLMLAWARARAAAGDDDGARHLAARLHEFRNPGADEFLAECEGAASTAAAASLPFQCQPPQRVWPWRDFLQPLP
jgi:O-antigen ligase